MYQSFYRKYRPKFLYDLVGQDKIVKVLKNSVSKNVFAHAYIFNGPRGTGKTSVAKILARNINCLNLKEGEACGGCKACLFSFDESCVDILELDAASNNGVDDIRKIVDNVSLMPTFLNYKVYIIDEVHMLSTGAFNALLKTLEEPPEHVVFILATTDLHKVPGTILSRCQGFVFEKIAPVFIEKKVKEICEKEKIEIESDVIRAISNLSDGGMRDALVLLDKVVAFSDGSVTYDDFIVLNGLVSINNLELFVDYIVSDKINNILSFVDNLYKEGKNIFLFLNQLVDYIRKVVVEKTLNNNYDFSYEKLLKFNLFMIRGLNDMRNSDNIKVFFEVLLLDFFYNSVEKNIEEKNVFEFEKNILSVNDKSDFVEEIVEKNICEVSKPKVFSKKNIKEKFILNIEDIMRIRFLNTIINSKKEEKNKDVKIVENLKNTASFSDERYLLDNLLSSNIVCSSLDVVVFSFDYDSILKENLANYLLLQKKYNDLSGSDKLICFINNDFWKDESAKFLSFYKKNDVSNYHNFVEEPIPVYEEISNDDIITSGAVDLFGDQLVEIEN